MITLENLIAELPPLRIDSGGTVRVGKTRVTLDTVIAVFDKGATAEEIVRRYPTLHLADVYAVISYYLHHRSDVEGYLSQRRIEAEEIRRKWEERCPTDDLRERMLAKRVQAQ